MNRQEYQHRGKLWEPRNQSRVCLEHFLNGKPTEAYLYPTENLGCTSTFKLKKKSLFLLSNHLSLKLDQDLHNSHL